MSPRQIPLKYFHALYDSPCGVLHLMATDSALCALAFESNWPVVWQRFAAGSSSVIDAENKIIAQTRIQLAEYFLGQRKSFDVPLKITGTAFQKQVWDALQQIPYGTVWNYTQQAEWLDRPKALRAVGSANGKNPIGILVPCHRVISKSGELGGYSGGLLIKKQLLQLEQNFS